MTSRARNVLLLSLLCFAGSVAVYGGGWYMVHEREAALRTQLEEQQRRAERDRDYTSLQKLYADSQADREKLRTFVVGADGVADFLELFEGAARRAGLNPTTRSVQVEKSEAGAKFEMLAINAEVQGSYGEVSAFLPIVETLPYQIEVRSVSIERVGAAGETDADEWRGLLQLRVSKEKSI